MRYWILISVLLLAGVTCAQKWDSLPRLPKHYQDRLQQFQTEKATKAKVLFLGGTHIEEGKWKILLKDSTVVNRGISGDITFSLLKRLEEALRFQPGRLFLHIGADDLAKGVPEDVVLENIFLIVGQIKKYSPTTKIFVVSLLPVNSSFPNFPIEWKADDRVTLVNAQLEKIQNRFGYTYVNMSSHFANEEGNLKKNLTTDGLRINQAGYQLWAQVIREQKYL
jgi:lysophospholipase L1-like esterase